MPAKFIQIAPVERGDLVLYALDESGQVWELDRHDVSHAEPVARWRKVTGERQG